MVGYSKITLNYILRVGVSDSKHKKRCSLNLTVAQGNTDTSLTCLFKALNRNFAVDFVALRGLFYVAATHLTNVLNNK